MVVNIGDNILHKWILVLASSILRFHLISEESWWKSEIERFCSKKTACCSATPRRLPIASLNLLSLANQRPNYLFRPSTSLLLSKIASIWLIDTANEGREMHLWHISPHPGLCQKCIAAILEQLKFHSVCSSRFRPESFGCPVQNGSFTLSAFSAKYCSCCHGSIKTIKGC